MAAGRKARPPALKILEGRSAGRDSGGRVIRPSVGFVRLPPEAPEWLGAIAREEWDRVVPELQRLKLTKPVDASALAAYCETVEVFVRAAMQVQLEGVTVMSTTTSKDGRVTEMMRAHPAVQIQLRAGQAIRAWCSEYGLSPAAEAKVARQEASHAEDDNPFGDAKAQAG